MKKGAIDKYFELSDAIGKLYPHYGRGRVPEAVMMEIGFHDCDWISLESGADVWWNQVLKELHPNRKLELHIPCRRPVEHLMSICNHYDLTLPCEGTKWREGVEKCINRAEMNRYSDKFKENERILIKCFPTYLDSGGIDKYINYMEEKGHLQRRTIQDEYVHRPTNKARNKTEECIWKDLETKKLVHKF